MSTHSVREWLVERVRLGEAPPDTQLTAEEQIRLRQLEHEDRAILVQYPPHRVASEVQRRSGRAPGTGEWSTRRAWMWVPAGAAVAGFAAFALSVGDVGLKPEDSNRLEPTRSKGGNAVFAYRATDTGVERVQPGDPLPAGVRVQISYRLEAPAYAVVLSVDGRGLVSLHLPGDKHLAPPELKTGRGALPYSYELDDAPKFERFFLITSEEPFRTQDIVDAAEALTEDPSSRVIRDPLDLPKKLNQSDLVLLKDSGQ